MPTNPNKLSKFWQEFRQRKVLPFLIGYIAACFAIIEFLTNTSERYSIPDTTVDLIYILAAVGLPIVIVLPWFIYRKSKNTKVDDLIIELKPPAQEKSIIVLPFENISPDPDQDFFSDGLTEEVITDLSYIHDLQVISRSSAMTFKGARKKIKEIADEVNVRYVLEGSVRKAKNNIRITAQLIDSGNDAHLWAEKYNGTLDDIFDIQEKVSRSIVDALKIKLSSKEERLFSDRPIDDIRAYECYLRARQEIWKFKEDALDRALEYLNSGLQIVGDNPILYSGISYVYWQYYNLGIRQDDCLEKAETFIAKTFEIDPESPYGHLMKGLINIFRDVRAGIKNLKQVLSCDPGNFDALAWLAIIYSHIGKWDIGDYLMNNLRKTDPVNPLIQFIELRMLVFKGCFREALISSEKYYNSFSEDPAGRIFYAFLLAYAGQVQDACSILNMIIKDTPRHALGRIAHILTPALQGRKVEVLKTIQTKDMEYARRDFVYSHWIADCYALVGENEKAMDWLEISVNQGMINHPFLNDWDPLLENIRSEPRFNKLMDRVKYEWEKFEI